MSITTQEASNRAATKLYRWFQLLGIVVIIKTTAIVFGIVKYLNEIVLYNLFVAIAMK